MGATNADERYLVTGAYGCIGAWTIRALLAAGANVTALDLADGSPRLSLVLDDERDPRLHREVGDITDLGALERVIDEHGVTRIIHLAALQVPFCRADPPAGAAVNVVGTANVFEAASRRSGIVRGVVYASSIAAYDAYAPGAPPTMVGTPGTIYGVYKRATEQMAELYAAERGLATIGLRPHTVFGPGRDQGLTSAPTKAMLAAAAGAPYAIPYTGRAQFQYAPDVAAAFVQAVLAPASGARVVNLAGSVESIDDVIAAIEAAAPASRSTITAAGDPLAFPEAVDASDLATVIGPPPVETPFPAAVAETIALFRRALAAGLVSP
jgi:nucleoside-diphosphate-sugar epimerase